MGNAVRRTYCFKKYLRDGPHSRQGLTTNAGQQPIDARNLLGDCSTLPQELVQQIVAALLRQRKEHEMRIATLADRLHKTRAQREAFENSISDIENWCADAYTHE